MACIHCLGCLQGWPTASPTHQASLVLPPVLGLTSSTTASACTTAHSSLCPFSTLWLILIYVSCRLTTCCACWLRWPGPLALETSPQPCAQLCSEGLQRMCLLRGRLLGGCLACTPWGCGKLCEPSEGTSSGVWSPRKDIWHSASVSNLCAALQQPSAEAASAEEAPCLQSLKRDGLRASECTSRGRPVPCAPARCATSKCCPASC